MSRYVCGNLNDSTRGEVGMTRNLLVALVIGVAIGMFIVAMAVAIEDCDRERETVRFILVECAGCERNASAVMRIEDSCGDDWRLQPCREL